MTEKDLTPRFRAFLAANPRGHTIGSQAQIIAYLHWIDEQAQTWAQMNGSVVIDQKLWTEQNHADFDRWLQENYLNTDLESHPKEP